MSTPQQASSAAIAPPDPNKALDAILDKAIEFVPFLSEQQILLTPRMVIRFMCKPTKSGKRATMEQALHFCMLCKARGLNPWEGDAYIVGYDTSDGPEFSLITAHQAFLKRAEVHPEYNGMRSGVIVKRGDDIVEEEGDFFLDADTLLGGWARVLFKVRETPVYKRLRLATFNKGFGRWRTDPAGMIVKCAEADALRSAFPNSLGGMYLEDEMPDRANPDEGGNGREAEDLRQKTIAKSSELKERFAKKPATVIDIQASEVPTDTDTDTNSEMPVEASEQIKTRETSEKKKLRRSITDLFTEEQIEKHTAGRDINALSLDELVQLKDGLSEYVGS